MNTTSHLKSWFPNGDAECDLVRSELESILASPPFRISRRYPALLRYVVEQTLAGNADNLKERTIGVEVFRRAPDYDTNSEPIVRNCAGEVRKRITQYYHDHAKNPPIEIELPLGSYAPVFHRVVPESEPAEGESIAEAAEPTPEKSTVEDAHHAGRRLLFYAVAAVIVLALAAAVTLYVRQLHRVTDPVTAVWAPLLHNPNTILISVGCPHTAQQTSPDSTDMTVEQHFYQPNFRVSMTAVMAITEIASYLHSQSKPYRFHESYTNTLADLHGLPVVLVNGNDNLWTLTLLKPLRFHFKSDPNDKFSYIEDAKHPERRDWYIDFTKPYLQQHVDYAIVARFWNATTAGPVLVVAGVGANGTEAAGDFMTTPAALEQLARLGPADWKNKNFEAVLRVEIIGGNTGSSTVEAAEFW